VDCGRTGVSECTSFLEIAPRLAIRADGGSKVKPRTLRQMREGMRLLVFTNGLQY